MYKKLALTFAFALAMFLGASVQTVQASSADATVAEYANGFTVEKKKKKKKKKKARKKNKKACTAEKSGCCASKAMGSSTSTSGNAGAVSTDGAKKNCATKCASEKKACTGKKSSAAQE